MLNTRVAGKYHITKKIGSGAFGEIFLGVNQSGDEFAVKFEKLSSHHPQLIYESKLLKILQGGPGIPSIAWAGHEGNFSVMVIELLGPSLEELFNVCNRKFSLKTSLMLADQILCRIEYLHSKSFIHRDIKPENLLIGIGKRSSLLYLIDFGLAKRYRDIKTHKHIELKQGKNLTGTARYASINTHLGIEQSRRDDLECIGYVILYLLKGSLPWQRINEPNRQEKYKKIGEKKISVSLEELCRGLPDQFKIYMEYCRSLKFDEKPDYGYLKRIFKEQFLNERFENDHIYDWTLMNYRRHKKSKSTEEEKKGACLEDQTEQTIKSEKRKKKKACNIF